MRIRESRRGSNSRESRGRVRFLDDADRERLLTECPSLKSALPFPIVVLAIAAGIRKGEIVSLRASC
jgi:hypothetical protein